MDNKDLILLSNIAKSVFLKIKELIKARLYTCKWIVHSLKNIQNNSKIKSLLGNTIHFDTKHKTASSCLNRH